MVSATTPTAGTAPDTVIDSQPATRASSISVAFSFHSTLTPASFSCKLDAAAAASCTSPVSYTGLSQGSHAFTVAATANGITDPTPATTTWTVDTVAPSVPTGLAASASLTSVALTWTGVRTSTG